MADNSATSEPNDSETDTLEEFVLLRCPWLWFELPAPSLREQWMAVTSSSPMDILERMSMLVTTHACITHSLEVSLRPQCELNTYMTNVLLALLGDPTTAVAAVLVFDAVLFGTGATSASNNG